MKLLTESLKKEFEQKFPLYSQDGKGKEAKAVCKFFNPAGIGTWYATEGGQTEDGDFLFFGYICLMEQEWGYWTLSQLEEIQIPVTIEGIGAGSISIERDINFPIGEKTVKQALQEDKLL